MKAKFCAGVSVMALAGFTLTAQAVFAAPQGCLMPDSFYKDYFLNPFNAQSAHHRPIGESAQYAGVNDPSTKSWNTAKGITLNVGAPWGVSVAKTTSDDPMKMIGAGPKQCDSVVGLPKAIRFPQNGFVTNVKQNANGCPDGVVVIYDSVSQVPHQLRQYNWSGGNPVAGQYKTWDIKGLGHGKKPGDRVGTSASGVAALFGVLRGDEINDTSRKVHHALQMVVPARFSDACAPMLSRQIVLPAVSGDGFMNSGNSNSGNIPYGALMALLPESKGGPDLTKLGLTYHGRRLAEAVREYGIYAVDTGACPAIRTDQYVEHVIDLKFALQKIYPYMRMVTNNDVLGTPTAGGGAPIGANCAYDGGDGGSTSSSSSGGGNASSGGASSSSSSSSGGGNASSGGASSSSSSSSGGGNASSGGGQCGSANGGAFSAMPALEKCVGGWENLRDLKTTTFGWRWKCVNDNGEGAVSCSAKKSGIDTSNGKCGSANGGAFSAMPEDHKCVGGWDSLRNLKRTSGGWTWQCVNGDGRQPVSCSAKKR